MTSNTGFLNVGTRCHHPNCSQIDYLPSRCPNCHNAYCSDHRADIFSCCAATLVASSSASPALRRRACAYQGCTAPSLSIADSDPEAVLAEPDSVPHYCAKHRYTSAPAPPPRPSKDDKNAAARALLAKAFPSAHSPPASPSLPPTPKPKPAVTAKPMTPAARKVELMRLRLKAKPGDSRDKGPVKPDERVHVVVALDLDGSACRAAESGEATAAQEGAKETVLYFKKGIPVGRCIDLLSQRFAVTSEATSDRSRQLHLLRLEPSASSTDLAAPAAVPRLAVLPANVPLGKVEGLDGSRVWLCRGVPAGVE